MPKKRMHPKEEFAYVLKWIKESEDSLVIARRKATRAIEAYKGNASKNTYSGIIKSYADYLTDNSEDSDALKECAKDIKEQKDLTIHNSVNTIVSMTMGGPGQYELSVTDPMHQTDPKTFDEVQSFMSDDYNDAKLDRVIPTYIRMAALQGASWLHVKYKEKERYGNKKGVFDVTLLPIERMILDPTKAVANRIRFRGFTQREPFEAVKSRIYKDKTGYKLKVVQETDVWLNDLVQSIDEPSNMDGDYLRQLENERDIFYNQYYESQYENIDKSEISMKDKIDLAIKNREVEMTYIYDYVNDMYFEIVNKKFIVVAKKNPLTKKESKGGVYCEDPLVELPFMELPFSRYPVSPVHFVLDYHDQLCSIASVKDHTLSIMAPLHFIGQPTDNEKMHRAMGVSGVMIEGMPQTFQVLNKAHDMSPILAAEAELKDKIKRTMGATDPYELAAMIGDRATAKEVSAVNGQTSQAMNPFIANVECALAELAQKMIKLRLVNTTDKAFPFKKSDGKYGEVARGDLAKDTMVRVKLKSTINMERQAQSRTAMELFSYAASAPGANTQLLAELLFPKIFDGTVRRQDIAGLYAPQPAPEPAPAPQPAQEEQDPGLGNLLNQDDLLEANPEDLDLSGLDPETQGRFSSLLGSIQPEGGLPPQDPRAPIQQGNGVAPFAEEGGEIANDPDRAIVGEQV